MYGQLNNLTVERDFVEAPVSNVWISVSYCPTIADPQFGDCSLNFLNCTYWSLKYSDV
jgi:hypothetical protein